MRRKPKRENLEIRGALLYLDDFFDLVQIMQDEVLPVEITADQFELENPEEITQLKQKTINDLNLSTGNPMTSEYLNVWMKGTSTIVLFERESKELYGRSLQIIEFLKSKKPLSRRLISWLEKPYLFGIAFLTLLGLFLFFLDDLKLGSAKAQMVLVVALGVLLLSVWCLVALNTFLDKGEKVPALILKERSQHTSFFERHKDSLEKLIIAVIGAIVGAWAKSFFDPK